MNCWMAQETMEQISKAQKEFSDFVLESIESGNFDLIERRKRAAKCVEMLNEIVRLECFQTERRLKDNALCDLSSDFVAVHITGRPIAFDSVFTSIRRVGAKIFCHLYLLRKQNCTQVIWSPELTSILRQYNDVILQYFK